MKVLSRRGIPASSRNLHKMSFKIQTFFCCCRESVCELAKYQSGGLNFEGRILLDDEKKIKTCFY
jgi:hypothetical protein